MFKHTPPAILIVDDDDACRFLYGLCLRDASYGVHEVGSVAGALGTLRSGRHFDLVLSDFHLGDGDGLALLALATFEGFLVRTGRIICTSDRDLRVPAGIGLLRKPLGPGDLLREVRQRLFV